MSYIIVSPKHYIDLEKSVNEYIMSGYMPIGSPYMSPDGRLSQAMLKTNEVVVKVHKTKKEKVNE